jgi:hypothetical protein
VQVPQSFPPALDRLSETHFIAGSKERHSADLAQVQGKDFTSAVRRWFDGPRLARSVNETSIPPRV